MYRVVVLAPYLLRQWRLVSAGRTEVYERRREGVQCYNGRDYQREVLVQNCACSIYDYEW